MVIVDLDCIAHFQPRGNSCHFAHDTRVKREKKQNVVTFVNNFTEKNDRYLYYELLMQFYY